MHTSRALDREKAEQIIRGWIPQAMHSWAPQIVDALEACVVPDPRLGRIEALCDDSDETGGGLRGWIAADRVRAILRGEQ